MSEENMMTPSLEDYLEMILELKQINGYVRVTDISAALNVSKPSVNQAITVLSEMGLIEYQKYKPILLTEKGQKRAEEIFEKHNLLKYFFMKVLNVSCKNAEADACNAEHILSDETIQKISEYMKKYEL